MKVRITKAGLFGLAGLNVGDVIELGAGPAKGWSSYYEDAGDAERTFITNPAVIDDAPDIGDMTVAELREFAKLNGIDLNDATKKDDILAAIELALSAE